MPAKDRPPSFQFYPRDWMADPAVQGMTWDQRGRYFWALCCSRLTDRPGIAAEDQWRRWMAYSDDEWPVHQPAIAPAFRVRGDGAWAQSRTVEDRREQAARHRRATAGADARWRKTKQLKASEASPPAYAGIMRADGPASASASALEDIESTPPAQSSRKTKPRLERIPLPDAPSLTTNQGETWQPTQLEIDAWTSAYPGLDVIGTIREAQAWLIANPTRRKTFNGMARYVNGWLSREQNRL